jgi:hypothetical protein
VLRQSGKVRFQRLPSGGNKGLKRVFYPSAFCSLSSPDSRAFYARKRREGKRHHQVLIALARRRIDVLWAILHTRQPQPITRRRLDERIRLHPLRGSQGRLRSPPEAAPTEGPPKARPRPSVNRNRAKRTTRRGRTTPPRAHGTKTPGSSARRGGAGQMSSRGRFRPRRR